MNISKVSAIFLPIILASTLLSTIIYQYNYSDEKQVLVGLRIKSAVLGATVDIRPEALNLHSKGKWITVYIEPPEGYNAAEINVSSIMLNDTVTAELRPKAIGDYDNDAIPDLMVKFDRDEVISYIIANIIIEERFMTITLILTGRFNDGTLFQGSDTIRIICVISKYPIETTIIHRKHS